LADAGKLHVVVKNPQPLINYRWGDTSNMAHILVPYAFSTELAVPQMRQRTDAKLLMRSGSRRRCLRRLLSG
jgi:hypothetical protein